jgi:hypothetical protein
MKIPSVLPSFLLIPLSGMAGDDDVGCRAHGIGHSDD